jgi:hypothetical protein
MKKYLILLPLVALILAGFMTSVYASEHEHEGCPEPNSTEFGQHIAMMAPGHPKMHSAMFGHMVSNMAQGNSCSH